MHSNVIMILIIIKTMVLRIMIVIIIIIFIIMVLCSETVSVPHARLMCQAGSIGRESHISFARLANSCAKDCLGILTHLGIANPISPMSGSLHCQF